jgi:hypothetical protein
VAWVPLMEGGGKLRLQRGLPENTRHSSLTIDLRLDYE